MKENTKSIPPPVLITSCPINVAVVVWWKCQYSFRCYYCDHDPAPQERSHDHIISRSELRSLPLPPFFNDKFGKLNRIPCCTSCNQWKGRKPLHAWRAEVRASKDPRRAMILRRIRMLLKK